MASSTSNLDLISSGQAQKEITANALFDAGSPAYLYGRRANTTEALTWGYYGGFLNGVATEIPNGTVTLLPNSTNYIEANENTGIVSVKTGGFTSAGIIRLYIVVTDSSGVKVGAFPSGGYQDVRSNPIKSGSSTLINTQSGNYTLVLADAGVPLLHPSSDATSRTFTIPANSSVPYPVGTLLTFINQNAAGSLTIAINTDTLRLAGDGTTASKTLAQNGIATAIKVSLTEWIISGVNLS